MTARETPFRELNSIIDKHRAWAVPRLIDDLRAWKEKWCQVVYATHSLDSCFPERHFDEHLEKYVMQTLKHELAEHVFKAAEIWKDDNEIYKTFKARVFVLAEKPTQP